MALCGALLDRVIYLENGKIMTRPVGLLEPLVCNLLTSGSPDVKNVKKLIQFTKTSHISNRLIRKLL